LFSTCTAASLVGFDILILSEQTVGSRSAPLKLSFEIPYRCSGKHGSLPLDYCLYFLQQIYDQILLLSSMERDISGAFWGLNKWIAAPQCREF
jgi:hypothetical protein